MAGKGSIQHLDVRETMAELIALMPGAERRAYDSMEHRQKFACFPGRTLVVYDLSRGNAANVELLFFGAISIDMTDGPLVHGTDGDGRPFTLGTIPTRHRDRELFLQVPVSFELEWRGQKKPGNPVEYQPHYTILAKVARKDPHVDGFTYCATLNIFKERFPNSNLRY